MQLKNPHSYLITSKSAQGIPAQNWDKIDFHHQPAHLMCSGPKYSKLSILSYMENKITAWKSTAQPVALTFPLAFCLPSMSEMKY